jgi:hypothetical protein
MNWTVKKKVNFVNSSQNEGLSPSGIALSFDGFGSISWHSVWFLSDSSFSFHIFPRISNFFDLSITEETWLVEMIKIVNVLVLHYNWQSMSPCRVPDCWRFEYSSWECHNWYRPEIVERNLIQNYQPMWLSGWIGGAIIWWFLRRRFESHSGAWVLVLRMRPYKPRSRVAVGVALKRTLTAKSHEC